MYYNQSLHNPDHTLQACGQGSLYKFLHPICFFVFNGGVLHVYLQAILITVSFGDRKAMFSLANTPITTTIQHVQYIHVGSGY